MPSNTQISLIMVEDDVDLCHTVGDFLQGEEAFQLLGMAHEEKGFQDLVRKHLPDLALIDIGLNTPHTGLDLLEWLRKEYPVVKPIIMTVNEGDVLEAYRRGARGYILKSKLETLIPSLQDVHQGKLIIPPEVGELFVQQVMASRALWKKSLEFQQLSEREREILQFLKEGKSREDIGDALGISFFTVRRHIQNILEKTGDSTIRSVVEKFGEVLGGEGPFRG
jgi:DNA-binding NarL/FixJ family response regulator